MRLHRFQQVFNYAPPERVFFLLEGWLTPCCVNTDKSIFLPVGNHTRHLDFRPISDTLKNKYLPFRPTFQPLKDKVSTGRTGLEPTTIRDNFLPQHESPLCPLCYVSFHSKGSQRHKPKAGHQQNKLNQNTFNNLGRSPLPTARGRFCTRIWLLPTRSEYD